MKELIRNLAPEFAINWYHLGVAFLSALIYKFPGRELTIIGVTGTNGKSTTVEMLSQIFQEAGINVASASSIRFQTQEKEWRNKMKMTMPGRFALQKFLRQAVSSGCTHVILEITSEGILQNRHRFIPFNTAVLTNISPEHIERHGSFEKYVAEKVKLFNVAKSLHIVNRDSNEVERFLTVPAEKIITYGMETSQEEGREHIQGMLQENAELVRFIVERTTITLQLLGSFNAYNAMAAIATAKAFGIPVATAKKALERIHDIPGRMEQVIEKPFSVVVDYAFTPAALEKVYKALKPLQGKLICVVSGTGGGRDRWKRPVLGKIAATHCDSVFVTDEDPYEEDPWRIIEQVAAGTNGKGEKILDRREAIRKAITKATAGDVVIITGKGSEDTMAIAGGKKIAWDDREIVREEFAQLHA